MVLSAPVGQMILTRCIHWLDMDGLGGRGRGEVGSCFALHCFSKRDLQAASIGQDAPPCTLHPLLSTSLGEGSKAKGVIDSRQSVFLCNVCVAAQLLLFSASKQNRGVQEEGRVLFLPGYKRISSRFLPSFLLCIS